MEPARDLAHGLEEVLELPTVEVAIVLEELVLDTGVPAPTGEALATGELASGAPTGERRTRMSSNTAVVTAFMRFCQWTMSTSFLLVGYIFASRL